jgi:ABC-type transport system substrate-binding protein
MEFALTTDAAPHDKAKARRLLAEAGFPNGFDAGEYTAIPGFPTVAEAVLNDLNAVGIRLRMRPMERATFYSQWGEKKLPGLFMAAAGNSGNAASRVETFIWSKGAYAHGGYPDIDELFVQQNDERDPIKRAAMLAKIQNLTIERSMFLPIMDLRGLIGIGPRIVKDTFGDVWMYPFASYEDMEIKG